MGKSQEVQLSMMAANGVKEANPMEDNSFPCQVEQTKKNSQRRLYSHWFQVTLYAVFVLFGLSAATLLERLYYEKGGKSKWMGTLIQFVGFPILLPCYCISASKSTTKNNTHLEQIPASNSMLAFIYISFGLFEALHSFLYSLGVLYLPVSTFSLISSSQLAFNALFSFFLNSTKFTPYMINSIILLTISSTLLVFHTETAHSTENSEKNHVIGFICAVAASAGYGLLLSVKELVLVKVLKRETIKVLMDMTIYESLVATTVILVGFFVSGEWSGLQKEMQEFELGKAFYLLTLIFTAIIWQLYSIGCIGLIFEVSSLFYNIISVLGMPIVPVLGVIFFQDKMHGVKAISMVLAFCGFISYLYQHYLDDSNSNTENRNTGHVPKASTLEEADRLIEKV